LGRIWEPVISAEERAIYEAAGYGKRGRWGSRPALIVIDVNYNFVGDRPEPILESIKRFHDSCGEAGWRAVPKISELLQQARRADIPIFYTTQDNRVDRLVLGSWDSKNERALEPSEELQRIGTRIVDEIAPRAADVVFVKLKPSAFFGTPLISWLNELRVDTLIVTGVSTSGCVRATTIDAFSYNFSVVVVEDCVFDRAETPHLVNLFDMHAKYADVVPLEEAIGYLQGLDEGVAITAR
jgi:nicotinamidase-related amidase